MEAGEMSWGEPWAAQQVTPTLPPCGQAGQTHSKCCNARCLTAQRVMGGPIARHGGRGWAHMVTAAPPPSQFT